MQYFLTTPETGLCYITRSEQLIETWSDQLLYFSSVSIVIGRPNKNFPNQYELLNFRSEFVRVVIAWVCVTLKVCLCL